MRLIPAVAAMAPEQALSSLLAVRLAVAQEDFAKAGQELDTALANWPKNGDLLRLCAQMALSCKNFPFAAMAAAAAVIGGAADADAKSLLGCALLALADSVQARICLQEAVAANPHDVPAVLALAQASPEHAPLLLAAASASMPYEALVRTVLIQSLINIGEAEAA